MLGITLILDFDKIADDLALAKVMQITVDMNPGMTKEEAVSFCGHTEDNISADNLNSEMKEVYDRLKPYYIAQMNEINPQELQMKFEQGFACSFIKIT